MKTNDPKYTKEEFLQIAINNGYGIFDFSKIEYNSLASKLLIKCPVHGWIYELADKFLIKRNNPLDVCIKCYNEHNHSGQKYTQEEFIEKVKKLHQNKKHLSFEKTIYKDSHTKATVTCEKHGDFDIQAAHILDKDFDCKYCKKEYKNKKSSEEYYNKFIKEAKNKWPEIDYSITEPCYTGRHNDYEICCKEHGIQKVKGHTFLKKGCPKCDCGEGYIDRQYTTQEFINELKKVYNDLYDFSETKYINWHTKVKVKCEKHGYFYREPIRLLKEKRGCPYCTKSLLENEFSKFLDNNNIKYERECLFDFLDKKRIDFYLSDYNVGIECQGRQHFYQNSKYNENIDINEVIKNDKYKFDICKEHGIKIYYYTNVNYTGEYFSKLFKNKEELLNNILKENG